MPGYNFTGIDNNQFNLEFNNKTRKVSYGDTLAFNFGKLVFNRLAINLPVTISPIIPIGESYLLQRINNLTILIIIASRFDFDSPPFV